MKKSRLCGILARCYFIGIFQSILHCLNRNGASRSIHITNAVESTWCMHNADLRPFTIGQFIIGGDIFIRRAVPELQSTVCLNGNTIFREGIGKIYAGIRKILKIYDRNDAGNVRNIEGNRIGRTFICVSSCSVRLYPPT